MEADADGSNAVVRVLVFGGSQGAHAVNVAMVEAAAQLAAGRPHLRITHQTGERDVEMVRAGYKAAGIEAEVEPFFYDMGQQLGRADVIVCRAGATTLAELAAAGRPSILIPLPTAADDHQRKNAEVWAMVGDAWTCCRRRWQRDRRWRNGFSRWRMTKGRGHGWPKRRATWPDPTPQR